MSGFAVRQGMTNHVATGHFDHRLLLVSHSVPRVEVDKDPRDRCRLVPTGEIVVLGNLEEAEAFVNHRVGELGRVDGAELQGLEDLAAGE